MIKFPLLGLTWKVFIFEEDYYVKKFGTDSEALTIPSDKEAYFNAADLSRETVAHEVWHMARTALMTNSARLTVNAEEEISAELFSHHGDMLIRKSRLLYKELKKLI